MSDARWDSPHWLICPGCRLYRRTRRHTVPAGGRELAYGQIHHVGTHQVFKDRAAYRRVTGPGSHDPRTEEHKDPADAGLTLVAGVWQ